MQAAIRETGETVKRYWSVKRDGAVHVHGVKVGRIVKDGARYSAYVEPEGEVARRVAAFSPGRMHAVDSILGAVR